MWCGNDRHRSRFYSFRCAHHRCVFPVTQDNGRTVVVRDDYLAVRGGRLSLRPLLQRQTCAHCCLVFALPQSIIPFRPQRSEKDMLNEKFKQKHADWEPTLSLSKIRSLKVKVTNMWFE